MNSVTGLFNQLLDAHISKELFQPKLNPTNTKLDKHRRALRASLYATLFANLNGPLQHNNSGVSPPEDWSDGTNKNVPSGVKEQLLQIVFQRRQERKYDEAHRLEGVVSSLPNVDNGEK